MQNYLEHIINIEYEWTLTKVDAEVFVRFLHANGRIERDVCFDALESFPKVIAVLGEEGVSRPEVDSAAYHVARRVLRSIGLSRRRRLEREAIVTMIGPRVGLPAR